MFHLFRFHDDMKYTVDHKVFHYLEINFVFRKVSKCLPLLKTRLNGASTRAEFGAEGFAVGLSISRNRRRAEWSSSKSRIPNAKF